MDANEETTVKSGNIGVTISLLEPGNEDLYLDVEIGDGDTTSSSCPAMNRSASAEERARYALAVLDALVQATEGIDEENYGARQLEGLVAEMAAMSAEAIEERASIATRIEAFRRQFASPA